MLTPYQGVSHQGDRVGENGLVHLAAMQATTEQVACKPRKYIPQGARGWKSKIKVPACSGEDSLPGQRLLIAFSCCGKSWELPGVPFERVLIPSMRGEP